jgi:DNA-binding winged helix-turn-helix (wHTH) protein
VGAITYDEMRAELLVDGQRRTIEAKPQALFLALLEADGRVVSKRALIEAAWGNASHTTDASLNTAMFKLRAALGENVRSLIGAVHGTGYRITAPISVMSVPMSAPLRSLLNAGDQLPGLPEWRLARPLGHGAIWLATHVSTDELRIVTCADTEAGLASLRRKADISAALTAAFGARDDFLPVVAVNFDIRPFFIASPYGGEDVAAWAAQNGGLTAISLERRIDIVIQAACMVATAHAAGVLHGAISPAAIRVAQRQDGSIKIRLADFGGDPAALYMAPEILGGGAPTAGADVFALGMVLYQMVTADLRRPLAAGWEADVNDPLLRHDIADSAAGDPARRAVSAAGLVDRLVALPARRIALRRLQAEAERSALQAGQLARSRQRRPWVIASALSLAAGLMVAAWFGLRARQERDIAVERAALAQAVNAFLTEDLLGRGNPAQSGKADETLMDAVEAAEANVDRRLAAAPATEGSIYLSMAHAFDSRSAFRPARKAYDQAVAAFGRAGDPADKAIARLQQVLMECVSGETGSLPRARSFITAALPLTAQSGARQAEVRVWLSAAQAMLALINGDFQAAQTGFKTASDQADAMPAVFNEGTRLLLKRRYAFTFLRMGDWDRAEHLFSGLLRQELALNGPRHPETLQVALNLAQTRMSTGRSEAALADLDRLYPVFLAVFGEVHRVTLDLLATRAQALLHLERYDDALRDQMTIYRAVVTKSGANSFKALADLTDAAETNCRAGHGDAGLADARSAFDGARATYGNTHALTGAAAGNLAFCLIAAGRPAEAAPFLDMVGAATKTQNAMDADYAAELSLMRAQIAVSAGDTVSADRLLTGLLTMFGKTSADPYMRRWAARLVAQRTLP